MASAKNDELFQIQCFYELFSKLSTVLRTENIK